MAATREELQAENYFLHKKLMELVIAHTATLTGCMNCCDLILMNVPSIPAKTKKWVEGQSESIKKDLKKFAKDFDPNYYSPKNSVSVTLGTSTSLDPKQLAIPID